jgi:hypothetical protein
LACSSTWTKERCTFSASSSARLHASQARDKKMWRARHARRRNAACGRGGTLHTPASMAPTLRETLNKPSSSSSSEGFPPHLGMGVRKKEPWGRLLILIVVKAGGLFCQISCTGCRSNHKKPFKITCLNRIPVLRFFSSSVHTHLFKCLIN